MAIGTQNLITVPCNNL